MLALREFRCVLRMVVMPSSESLMVPPSEKLPEPRIMLLLLLLSL